MHTLDKIKLFRIVLWMTYPFALLFVYPFVLLRKKNKSHLFFFFDKYDMGGAPRIHIDILNSVADIPKQLYFTRISLNKAYRKEFFTVPNTEVHEVNFWCENLLFRIFSVHYFAFYINRHKKAHVFSSISTFFYDMLPFLGKHVVKTELLHLFNYDKKGIEFFGLGTYKYLTYRMVYDSLTVANLKQQYKEYNIPDSYLDRIKYIETGVEIPAAQVRRDYADLPLRILYAGRGGPQKRIDRLDRIAKYCLENKLPVEFHFAGDMMNELSAGVRDNSVLHGLISDIKEMYALYANSHAILLTSAFEGFPMFVKESMACGCVPVVTALEGNKTHLTDGQNAMLMHRLDSDDEIVREGIAHIKTLVEDAALVKKISENAYNYAAAHFDIEDFKREYNKFLQVY